VPYPGFLKEGKAGEVETKEFIKTKLVMFSIFITKKN